MRRIWAAVLLIVLTVGICTLHHYNLKRVYKETDRYLKKVVSQYEKGKYIAASYTANELENNWAKNEKMLDRFVSEDKLEDVRMTIAEIPYLAEYDNRELVVHVERLYESLEHIVDKEKPRLY